MAREKRYQGQGVDSPGYEDIKACINKRNALRKQRRHNEADQVEQDIIRVSNDVFQKRMMRITEPNTIDLHEQPLEQAKRILDEQVQNAKRRNQTFMHVIVGKGNHSAGHIGVIKPAVEEYCGQHRFSWRIEHNEGRIYIDITGSQNIPVQAPPLGQGHTGTDGYVGHHYPEAGQQPWSYSPGYQQPPHQQYQQYETAAKGCFSFLFKLFKAFSK